jgi:hypothetical protein
MAAYHEWAGISGEVAEAGSTRRVDGLRAYEGRSASNERPSSIWGLVERDVKGAPSLFADRIENDANRNAPVDCSSGVARPGWGSEYRMRSTARSHSGIDRIRPTVVYYYGPGGGIGARWLTVKPVWLSMVNYLRSAGGRCGAHSSGA